MSDFYSDIAEHKEMTREELLEHFQRTSVPPPNMYREETELAMEVVYYLLPLYKEEITDYASLLKGKTVIAFGFSNNEKRYLKRHVEEYGGKFRFTQNNEENFFIVHPGTWLYDMTYAWNKAKEEGATIVDYDHFVSNFEDYFDDDEEERRKAKERNEKASRPKKRLSYKPCSEDFLSRIKNTSLDEISLEEDIFHVTGRVDYDCLSRVNGKLEYHKFNSQKSVYDAIINKGGLTIKQEKSKNITCIVYGYNPAEDVMKEFLHKVKLISLNSFMNWLENQKAINPKCREFGRVYSSTKDEKLRKYQQDIKQNIFKKWNSYFNVMLQLPTGTGKTVLFTSIINDLNKVPETKILILAHRKELIDQISEQLKLYSIEHGIIASGRVRNKELNIQVASVQTLTHDNNIDLLNELNPKFIIIDEAHHSLADSYTKFWKSCGDCWKLGVTATPYRLNNRSFESHFDKLIVSDSINSFIKEGYLAQYVFLVDNPTSSLSQTIKAIKEKSSTGDYKTATLMKELNVEEHIQRLIVCYEQYVKGKKGIVYAINKEHAHNICEAYKVIGVNSVYIDSDTPKGERKKIVEQFKNNEIQVMVNVDIFSEGFDCPDVEFIQLARPTWSLAKYLQQVGRGLRPSKNKEHTVILDNSRMFAKFGMPSDDRLWKWHFSGDPFTKKLYKHEDENFEAVLFFASKNSSEMMIKIDQQTINAAIKNKSDLEESTINEVYEIDENDGENKEFYIKLFAGIATAVVALILINTIGLFGLAAMGLIAGGLLAGKR